MNGGAAGCRGTDCAGGAGRGMEPACTVCDRTRCMVISGGLRGYFWRQEPEPGQEGADEEDEEMRAAEAADAAEETARLAAQATAEAAAEVAQEVEARAEADAAVSVAFSLVAKSAFVRRN